MPIGIGAGTAIAGIIGGGAAVTGALINTHGQGEAADAASKSNAAALEFQKQQAEADYKNQETARKANYDQYVAKQTAMNQVRQGLGLKPVDIPPYVPSLDPGFTGAPPATSGPTTAPTPGTKAPPASSGIGLGALAGNGTAAPGLAAPPPTVQPPTVGSLGYMAQGQGPAMVDANGNPIPVPPNAGNPFTLKRPIQF